MQKSENTHKEDRIRENKKRYRDKMRSKGMVQLCIWIPKSILEKVKKYIERIKND